MCDKCKNPDYHLKEISRVSKWQDFYSDFLSLRNKCSGCIRSGDIEEDYRYRKLVELDNLRDRVEDLMMEVNDEIKAMGESIKEKVSKIGEEVKCQKCEDDNGKDKKTKWVMG